MKFSLYFPALQFDPFFIGLFLPFLIANLLVCEEGRAKCPSPDFLHRYVSVSVDEDLPELGNFEIYSEINSDFKSEWTTVLWPSYPDAVNEDLLGSWADSIKTRYFNDLPINVLVTDVRGASSCSSVPKGLNDIDFIVTEGNIQKAYYVHRLKNRISDMESVRKEFLGSSKIILASASGGAMTNMAYFSKYSKNVLRMLAVSGSNLRVKSAYVQRYFIREIEEHGLLSQLTQALDRSGARNEEFIWALHGLDVWGNKPLMLETLLRVARGDLAAIDNVFADGKIPNYVRSTNGADRKPSSMTTVFQFYGEYTPLYGYWNIPDVNVGIRLIANKMLALIPSGLLQTPPDKFADVSWSESEVLLVAGIRDPQVTTEMMISVHNELKNSKLALFDDVHVLLNNRKCYSEIFKTFVQFGRDSKEFSMLIRSQICSNFLRYY